MEKVHLTIAVGDYDRTKALQDGRVQPEGIRLNCIPFQSTEEIFWRMVKFKEFDASEMSFSTYITLRSRQDSSFVAIPVFPSRLFRHSYIFVNLHSGIQKPEDLKGKKVGVPGYSITAAVWLRGMFRDDYGVSAQDIEWFIGGQEDPGGGDRIELHLPAEIRVSSIPQDRTLNAMLESEEIDGLFAARVPSCFAKGSSKVGRLFPNYKEVEIEYYRRTKIFPIMHVVVIRRDVYDRYPWVARSLYKAFLQAKELCMQNMHISNTLVYTLPWLFAEIDQVKTTFGPDWWSYGIDPNRPTLETLIRYMGEQGLLEIVVKVEDLFVPNVAAEFKI